MKHAALPAAILLILPLLTGCAGNPLRPVDTTPLEQEIQRLRAQVVELQRQAAMNEVEMARLRQQLGVKSPAPAPAPTRTEPSRPAPVRTEPTRTATTATAPPAAPRQQPVQTPRTTQPVTQQPPVQTPPQTPKTTQPAPVQPRPQPAQPARPEPSSGTRVAEEEIEEADIDLPEPAKPARTAPQTTPSTRPATPPPAPQPSAPAGESGPEVLSPTSQALYDRGYTLYHQGHFVDAEGSFQRFLQGNPKSELADNAQYWIGECRYSRGDFRGALAAFRETVTKFPEGNKVPDALLKAGQCQEALNDVDGARGTYQEVTRRFPGTAAASVAQERRAKLP